jgi:PadR family transcriptional regulator PadR
MFRSAAGCCKRETDGLAGESLAGTGPRKLPTTLTSPTRLLGLPQQRHAPDGRICVLHAVVAYSCCLSTGVCPTSPADSEVPYGTLDLMVLKTLAVLGPLHGYGVARRIEQAADGGFLLNQGTIYPALLRLEQKGWISSAWGTSDNNRRARFYSITAKGRRQLAAESELWARTVSIVNRLLEEDS